MKSSLDRFLCMMEEQDVPVVICFNKDDLVDDDDVNEISVKNVSIK